MSRRIRPSFVLTIICGCLLAAPSADAGIWRDVLVGLDEAGFQGGGQRNPLSNGVQLSFGQNFQNTLLDFGATEVTLTGPVAANVVTGNRGFRTFDFNIIAGNDANPLIYSFISDMGGNAVQVDGSSVVDISGSINQFGWYDMTMDISSRQTYSSTGRFANSDGENLDYDIGPVHVRGNIFADLLAVLTDPMFEAAGTENFFGSFSGRSIHANALTSTVSGARAKTVSAKYFSGDEIAWLVQSAIQPQVDLGLLPDSLHRIDEGSVAAAEIQAGRAVPEPSTIALLLLPAVAWRRKRRA